MTIVYKLSGLIVEIIRCSYPDKIITFSFKETFILNNAYTYSACYNNIILNIQYVHIEICYQFP